MPKKFAANTSSIHLCPACDGSKPHIGGPVSMGSSDVFIGGQPAARVGDWCRCQGPPDKIASGVSTIFVNGKLLAGTGDTTGHGGVINTGEPTVIIGARGGAPVDVPVIEAKFEPEEPVFQGEILFVNGYLSNPLKNAGGTYNALMDRNPDEDSFWTPNDANLNEGNRADPADMYTSADQEAREFANESWTRFLSPRYWYERASGPIRFNPHTKYVQYWNKRANNLNATKKYAEHFNALGRVHYVNGSHGLGSNGAHRVDHGISMGYTWAERMYDIDTKAEVDAHKGKDPSVEERSPKYKPVTVVGHSQGACLGAGVALGVMKYAAEKGYSDIPINLIFLGVHQPKGLSGAEYDEWVNTKVNDLEVDTFFFVAGESRFLPGVIPQGEEEEAGVEFVNSLSDLFNPKYKKIYNERGLWEHVSAITGNWGAYAARAVQFTFSNDRADIVYRDGDVPNMDCASDPVINTKLFSAEFHQHGPPSIDAGREVLINLATAPGGTGGYLVLPEYTANKRFDFDSLPSIDEPIAEANRTVKDKVGDIWGDYTTVATRWGVAMYDYKTLRDQFEGLYGDFNYSNYVRRRVDRGARGASDWVRDRVPLIPTRSDDDRRRTDLYHRTGAAYEEVLKTYVAVQTAELYAHFSPVSLIDHELILSDWPGDALGKLSVRDRIEKLGASRFYRVQYPKDISKIRERDLSEEQRERKRALEKEYVADSNNLGKSIATALGDTSYINDVIQAFVHGDKDAESRLFHEEKPI